jgi:hypothetical protein
MAQRKINNRKIERSGVRSHSQAGLPDGILFSYPNPQFWYVLKGPVITIFDIIDDHLVYVVVICFLYEILNILWTFDIFSPLWSIVSRKIWQPCSTGQTF